MQGKTIVVTGGSMGIGLAIAQEAAKLGARLVLVARTENALEQGLSQLVDSQRHSAMVCDVAQQCQVDALARKLQHDFGTIDGLVNCAGIYGPIGRLGELDMEQVQQAFDINFFGTLRVCQSLLPLLSQRKKIVNLAGGGAASPFANYTAYACSKAALARFTENLALEYPDLDVNCLAPGFVLTRFHEQTLAAGPEKCGQSFYQQTQQQYQTGGVSPKAAAELTCFLLSPESDGISGKFIAAPWDPWREPEFQEQLRTRKHFATLRRIDDRNFRET
jgi:NAD(P)-dependent dehydrogenase (short-subunit alcohol dehydrogenase family)